MDRPARHALVIFLRLPVPGRVKTRLARDIGADAAANVYARLVDITLRSAEAFPGPVYLYYDGELPPVSDRIPAFHYECQAGQDLGARMHGALTDVLSLAERVILVGSDCPDIRPDILSEALEHLRAHDVVVGPSVDGGYYLIGCKRPPGPKLFSDIPWSTGSVLEITLQRCRDLSLTVARLPILSDIDTAADMRRLGWT